MSGSVAVDGPMVPARLRACVSRGMAAPLALFVSLAAGCGREDAGATPVPEQRPVPDVCIGVTPSPSAWGADPSCDCGEAAISDAGTAVGPVMPSWALFDFQPQSCGFEATYGPDLFRGQVVLLAVLESS